jgi:signal transduction histidine kinase
LIGELVIDAQFLQALFRRIDPRRSLIAGAIYLICVLAIAFSTAAAIWVGGIARENVLEQHVRRLSLETDQLSSHLSEAIAARVGALNTARILLGRSDRGDTALDLGRSYEELVSAYPQLDWVAIADVTGTVVRSDGSVRVGVRVETRQWFTAGLKGPWVGVIEDTQDAGQESARTAQSDVSALGDLSVPVHDNEGHILGVIAAHLSWRRTPNHAQRLTDEADSPHLTEAYVLNAADVVLVGPASSRGKPWSGVPIDGSPNAPSFSHPAVSTAYPVFERLTDGRRVLVSRAPLNTVREMAALGLQVLLSEPNERVYQRANAVTKAILWASLSIGAIIAFFGALGIRHLTRRLERLTLSVASVRRNDTATIEVPDGIDEVSQLGEAFSNLIVDLAQERSELERRVAVRTLEVERLAEESRYAAVVRERLKLARALHDTLAHSMMAIISEIRFIRRLQTQDPASVPDELGRAEELAHEGLSEARSAIAQMRATTVREAGLGPALSDEFDKFVDRTGLVGEFRAEPVAAQFGDERSEVLLRMAQEALRNIDRHAKATRVAVTLEIVSGTHLVLRIEDDGVGFDPQTPRLGHYGLIGLHEQAELIGADLRIDSKPQMGTKICISLPISPIVFASPMERSPDVEKK